MIGRSPGAQAPGSDQESGENSPLTQGVEGLKQGVSPLTQGVEGLTQELTDAVQSFEVRTTPGFAVVVHGSPSMHHKIS